MQQHCSQYFACRAPHPHPGPGDGVNGSKFNFSENGHFAYQIKEKHDCGNMVANVLPPTLMMGSKGQNLTFSEHSHAVYHLKGNHEMQQRGGKYFARRPSPPPPTLGRGSVGQNQNF